MEGSATGHQLDPGAWGGGPHARSVLPAGCDGGMVFGLAADRGAAPHVSVCLARAPGESERCERPQGASMYGDGVKYPHTVSEYWIQAGASMRILNTGLGRYPKSIRVSMRLPGVSLNRLQDEN